MQSHILQDPRKYIAKKCVRADQLSATSDIAGMDDIVLLTQTGYLTVKRREGPDLVVSYPNREVACSMAALYSEWLLSNPETRSVPSLIAKAAASGNAEMIMEELGRAFLAVNCMAYPVTNEAVCQGLVQLFFRGAGLYAAAETAGAFGRSDIEFDAGRLRWVFELKFQKAEESAERAAELLEEAKRQIAERQYGESSGKELVRVAAVFSERSAASRSGRRPDRAAGGGKPSEPAHQFGRQVSAADIPAILSGHDLRRFGAKAHASRVPPLGA